MAEAFGRLAGILKHLASATIVSAEQEQPLLQEEDTVATPRKRVATRRTSNARANDNNVPALVSGSIQCDGRNYPRM
jgi:hypothetical protein